MKYPKGNGSRWTDDDKALLELAGPLLTPAQLSELLLRTECGVKEKARQMGVVVRQRPLRIATSHYRALLSIIERDGVH